MAESIPKFLKRDGDKLLFNQDGEFIFYVPELYFTRSCAIIVGDMVNIIGVLDYTILDKNGKNNGLHLFRFPTVFLTRPNIIEKCTFKKNLLYAGGAVSAPAGPAPNKST